MTHGKNTTVPFLFRQSTKLSNERFDDIDLEQSSDGSEKSSLQGTTPALPSPSLAPVTSTRFIPPDGGRDAWLCVIGGWCCVFVSFGWITCVGTFQNYFQTMALPEYSPQTIAWIPSTEMFMMFALGPVYGKLFDMYGTRFLLIFGTTFHILGLLMMSFSTKYYQFLLAQGVCSSLGASALFCAANNSVGTWFSKRRALALGIVTSGSSLSGAVMTIMIAQLLPRIGFGWTIRIVSLIFLTLCLIAVFTVRSALPHTVSRANAKPFSLWEFIRPFEEPPFLFICLGCFFFFWGVFPPWTFLILQSSYTTTISPHLAIYLVPILNAAGIPGRILPGFLADRCGRFNAVIATTFASSVLVLALWIPSKSVAGTLVFAVGYGFTSGAFISLAVAVMAQISKIEEIGVRMGTLMVCIGFAVLTGSPIGGALVSMGVGLNTVGGLGGRGYVFMQIFSGLSMMVGCGFFVASRIKVGGWTWGKV
ncbi:MFS general substrate transporter [Ascobolus immersus RN42]|uniref:MFS general substrate transporter n=1 Tax=Ascobolus immersus RN42 TaxID=1160509 RepID=A0A3N4IUI6_ASCIM|nr:MFS general substrate transporter [Ascobolus immersus RN42]